MSSCQFSSLQRYNYLYYCLMNILFSLFSKQRDIMIQVANMRQHLWLLQQEEIKIKMVAQASTHFLHQQYPVQQP